MNNSCSVQIGYRLETADPALKQQGHHEGLHRVVIVVPQRQLVEAPLHNCLIQGAPAHFRAQGAGILLLTVVKNNGSNFRLHNGIGYADIPAQRFYARVVHSQPHVDGKCLQFKGLVEIRPQARQQGEQHQRVLSAGNANGNPVSLLNHIIVVHAPADKAHKLLHW